MMRALWHWDNSRTYCQERTPSLQLLPIPVYQSRLGWGCLCLLMKDTVKTRARLPLSTDWPVMTCVGISYNLILLIIGLHDQPVQISINVSGLAGVCIPPNSIVSNQDSVFTCKSWSPQYHFRARLRLPPTCLWWEHLGISWLHG